MNAKRLSQKDFSRMIEGYKIYNSKLLDKDFLIVYKNTMSTQQNSIEYLEVECRKNNFMHLTGVVYNTSDQLEIDSFSQKIRIERIN